jgi:type II secretory pathway component PulJ
MRRDGRLLLELMVALPLIGLLGLALTTLFITQTRVTRASRERAARAEASRATASILRSELRALLGARDVRSWSRDSIALRAFRGVAVPCDRSSALVVRYEGLRAPDPRKDSVLSVQAGLETVHLLRAVRDTTLPRCSHARAATQVWLLDPAPTAAGILMPFETGTYSLGEGALRYRSGSGGRQPITEEILDTRASRFDAPSIDSVTAVHVTVQTRLGPAPPRLLQIRLLNARHAR